MSDASADPYVIERLRTALAEDPRVAELGIDVAVEGDRVVLTGEVATEGRLAAVEAVARELAPGHQVDNRTTAAVLAEPGEAETLP